MIKGVNKQVVDVAEPDSAYFERVLFFVKPEFSGLGEGALRSKADLLLRETEGERVAGSRRPLKKRLGGAVRIALAAFLGAAVAAVTLLIALK
jgi:hypothetical protein